MESWGRVLTSSIFFVALVFGQGCATLRAKSHSPYRLSDETIALAMETAKKESAKSLRERRPAGLEQAEAETDFQRIIELSMQELGSDDSDVDHAAQERLHYLWDLAFDALAEGLKSDDTQIRTFCASELGKRGTRAAPVLVEVLSNDPSVSVQMSVFVAFWQAYDSQIAPLLLPILEGSNDQAKLYAIMALEELRNPETFDAVHAFFDNPDNAGLRDAAAGALLAIDRVAGTKAVLAAVRREEEDWVRHNLRFYIKSAWEEDERYGWPPELLPLYQLARDASTIARESYGDAEIAQLIAHVDSDNWLVSYHCLRALGELKTVSAVPAILALEPRDSTVYSALAMIGSPDAVTVLLNAVQSLDGEQRKTAVQALGDAGRWAAPVLVECLDDRKLHDDGKDKQFPNWKWPENHEAYRAFVSCLMNAGLTSSFLSLARHDEHVFDIDAEIERAKSWWAGYGEDFLQGRPVSNPNLTQVFSAGSMPGSGLDSRKPHVSQKRRGSRR